MRLVKFLNAPYPFYEDSNQGLRICIGIGLFISVFCLLFKPFGLEQVAAFDRFLYGVVSFVICAFFIVLLPLVFTKQLTHKNWKVYKEIIWIIIITTTLSTANYFYSGYAFRVGYAFDLKSFMIVLLYTSVIAILPAIAIILYKQMFVYKKIVQETQTMSAKMSLAEINTKDAEIQIKTDSKKSTFKVNTSDFILIASSGNYIEVYYHLDQMVCKELLRINISKVEKQLPTDVKILRCHRSYIINLDKISNISGNLQGYQLKFDGLEFKVPVSRSYSKVLKSRILNN